ncbi:Alpha/Beta hydrolase protein [Scleroderma citrinum]
MLRLSLLFIASVVAAPNSIHLSKRGSPLVALDYGSFEGFSSAFSTESFLGVPFAQPPIGNLRFNKPVSPSSFTGVKNATWYGNACPQMPLLAAGVPLPDNPGLSGVTFYLGELQPHGIVAASEDCLYINVVRPAGVPSGAKLPVVVWIYGGGFMAGDASAYNGTNIVARSMGLKTPVIYVSFNYRLNSFGFLGGKEVQEAGLGNLGLYDQRSALEWVQKYISTFGGDPEKVIIWGQSAGSISAMLQMVAYDGKLNGLFQGAVMESGSIVPLHDITSVQQQENYDFLVTQTNCKTASDTLNCLRQVPYQALLNATLETNALLSYQSLNTTWKPAVDGVFLKQTVRESLRSGKYAKVPAILGDVDDEGTLFSLYSFNVTTNDQFLEYIRTVFLVGLSDTEISLVGQLYPDDPTQGSPFGIGTNDTLTPEYKRISAFLGDFYFQAGRRYALSIMSTTQNVWSYLWKRDKFVPGIGSFHESDLQEFYDLTGTPDWVGADALINFAYTLNPNTPQGGYPSGAASSLLSGLHWQQWSFWCPELLTFEDPNVLTFSNDTFRAKAIAYLNYLSDQMGL